MDLFVFGLGYSALHFVRTRRDGLASVAGTVRGADKAQRLAGEGIAALRFDDGVRDAALADRLARASALLVSVPPSTTDPVLQRYLDAIGAASRLATIVYLSTIGVYGDHGGGWVDEATPPRPAGPRGRERLEAETAWIALGRRTGKAVHVLRLGGIYGPGRSALDKLRDGTARRLVKPGQVFNRIHVEDIARSIDAAFADRSPGGVWNVTDDEPAPPQDVIAYAAALLGIGAPPEVAFETADLPAMARSFYSENKRVANTRLKRDLGVRLAYPTYREGLAALLRGGEAGTAPPP
jgi:nucleoside-diphosphate-sugar epimerase